MTMKKIWGLFMLICAFVSGEPTPSPNDLTTSTSDPTLPPNGLTTSTSDPTLPPDDLTTSTSDPTLPPDDLTTSTSDPTLPPDDLTTSTAASEQEGTAGTDDDVFPQTTPTSAPSEQGSSTSTDDSTASQTAPTTKTTDGHRRGFANKIGKVIKSFCTLNSKWIRALLGNKNNVPPLPICKGYIGKHYKRIKRIYW
ncbi:uncharacterized protein LOC133382047 isoform X1 [Rhineura floridana]|uniref:uncharacterized protein LOC133382047 isoform X1 n=1 Tax=Rhineura floridana TaxID=261503 RepID=UPI002AC88040|nr:uncharacterized protein LOC133382047 isoform X1 [Rhineura floridana]